MKRALSVLTPVFMLGGLPAQNPVVPPLERAAESTTSPLQRESADELSRSRRDVAAKLSEAADADDATVAMLKSVAEAALPKLAGSPASAERIRAAIVDSGDLAKMQGALRRIASDLRFEPSFEADVPPDWPPTAPIGEVVLKRYPQYRVARAEGGRRAFYTLFNHIKSNDVKMTVPVEMSSERRSTMGFLYERPDQGRTGEQGAVQVVDVPEALFVSTGLRGYEGASAVRDAESRIEAWIAVHNGEFEVAGEPRTMIYNGPSVRGNRRFYEVEVPVRRRPATASASATSRPSGEGR